MSQPRNVNADRAWESSLNGTDQPDKTSPPGRTARSPTPQHGRSQRNWFEIMERLDAQGDAGALHEIETLVENQLRSRGNTPPWVMHEDLIQDVLIDLLRAWRSRSIREPERFAGFVRTLACRRLADAFGREHRACALDRQHAPGFDVAAIATAGLGPSQLKLDARRALAKLDRATLRALEAVYGEGWTYEEAASLLRVPLGTLKRRLTCALRQLREDLVGAEVDVALHSATPGEKSLRASQQEKS
jgi:RNA polymerase sigma factor (sigma-70 family)